MVAVVTLAGDTHIIPRNNVAGRLQQATASDLSPWAGGPEPVAARREAWPAFGVAMER
jgi:hypothetical protein